ncbi:MAG: hypothetical protein FD143_3741, partial [Ignavibacteria bacterium]
MGHPEVKSWMALMLEWRVHSSFAW